MPYNPVTPTDQNALAAEGLPNQGLGRPMCWEQWIQVTGTGTASTAMGNYYVCGVDSGATTSNVVYTVIYASPTVNYINVNYNYVNVVETAEQKATRLQCEAEAAAKRQVAEARAEELLIACLTDEQIKQYQQHGYFETDVNDKRYRIKKGRAGNVFLIEAGKPKYKYCAHPHTMTPDQDVMLSQLLMLRTDEARFLATANRTQLM